MRRLHKCTKHAGVLAEGQGEATGAGAAGVPASVLENSTHPALSKADGLR